jgi:hypothetical protein
MTGDLMRLARWLIVPAALLLAAPALAADPVYPPGSRIGLVPPPGAMVSDRFFGFQDTDNDVAIVCTALPAEAFAEIERTATPETLERQGVVLDKAEPLTLAAGKAFLVTGHQDIENMHFRKYLQVVATPDLTALITVQVPERAAASYPDEAIRTALASVAVRAAVPVGEQLSLLPFEVDELSSFKVAGILPGRAVMLSDGALDARGAAEPHIVIALVPGAPAQAGDRENFARDAFATIPNIRDVRITNSEPLRLGGQPGHQMMATAIDPVTGGEVVVVQWVRFGGGAFLHMVGVAPIGPGWAQAYPRFRAVRDGIAPR